MFKLFKKIGELKSSQNCDLPPAIATSQSYWEIVEGNVQKTSCDRPKQVLNSWKMFAWYPEKHKHRNTEKIDVSNGRIVQSCITH